MGNDRHLQVFLPRFHMTRARNINKIDANWDAIEEAPCERLITSVAMICPFEPPEKQALLEAITVPERIKVLSTLVSMAVMSVGGENFDRQ